MWHFAWWWMLLALPLPWLIRVWLKPQPLGQESALRVPRAEEFADLAHTDGVRSRHRGRVALLALIWALVVVAAARPQWVGEAVTLPMTGRDLLLAVDLSGSMEQQDFNLNGQWVDRLTATKAVAKDFIAHRVGDRIGLILFGREVYLQTPLTFDRATVEALLSEAVIGLAGKETAIGDAIGLAIRTFDDAGVDAGRRVLVLVTDGANTAGAVEPLKAAALAAERGMVIYTIGIGADELMVQSLFGVRRINPSADLDEQTLTAIAEQTGGRYFRAHDVNELAEIYTLLDELEPAASEESGFRPVQEYFHWPLGAALLLALVWLAAGVLGARFLPLGVSRGEAA